MSSTNPGHGEAQAEALQAAVVEAVSPFATDGMITEVVESYALIATRPDAA
jgi:hypothetical protein